jgi:hypothetical protein
VNKSATAISITATQTKPQHQSPHTQPTSRPQQPQQQQTTKTAHQKTQEAKIEYQELQQTEISIAPAKITTPALVQSPLIDPRIEEFNKRLENFEKFDPQNNDDLNMHTTNYSDIESCDIAEIVSKYKSILTKKMSIAKKKTEEEVVADLVAQFKRMIASSSEATTGVI